MRKLLFQAALLVTFAAAIAVIPSSSQAQPYYGGMMGGYSGYGMMGQYGYGPGMMYGYGWYGHHRGPHYRGRHLCWHRTGPGDSGFYGSCRG